MSKPEKWEVWLAEVRFEDSPEKKKRPSIEFMELYLLHESICLLVRRLMGHTGVFLEKKIISYRQRLSLPKHGERLPEFHPLC